MTKHAPARSNMATQASRVEKSTEDIVKSINIWVPGGKIPFNKKKTTSSQSYYQPIRMLWKKKHVAAVITNNHMNTVETGLA